MLFAQYLNKISYRNMFCRIPGSLAGICNGQETEVLSYLTINSISQYKTRLKNIPTFAFPFFL